MIRDMPVKIRQILNKLWPSIRNNFDLKSQLTISISKTATIIYKTIQEKKEQRLSHYKDEHDNS